MEGKREIILSAVYGCQSSGHGILAISHCEERIIHQSVDLVTFVVQYMILYENTAIDEGGDGKSLDQNYSAC